MFELFPVRTYFLFVAKLRELDLSTVVSDHAHNSSPATSPHVINPAPTFVFQISVVWIHFQAALVSDHAHNLSLATSLHVTKRAMIWFGFSVVRNVTIIFIVYSPGS